MLNIVLLKLICCTSDCYENVLDNFTFFKDLVKNETLVVRLTTGLMLIKFYLG